MIKYNNNDLKSRFITDSTGAIKEVKSVYVGSNKVWGSSVAPFFVKITLSNKSVITVKGSGALMKSHINYGNIRKIETGTLCTSIANNVFGITTYDYNLTDVVISSTVTSIGTGNLFSKYLSLKHIVVDEENPVYDSRNNCNAIIETASNTLIAGCVGSFIPSEITKIGDRALSDIWLNGHQVPSWITIPNKVTHVGNSAFSSNTGTLSVSIGSGIETIGNMAFVGCSSVQTVNIYAITPPMLGSSVFNGLTKLKNIYVPAESVEAYKSASGWSDYADIIQTR